MKVTVKIYHILQDRLSKVKATGNLNKNYLAGYKQALLDSVKIETEINKGNLDYIIKKNGHSEIIKPKEL